jgi:SAM-dependent methyltransferase
MANTTAAQNPQKKTYLPPILAYDRWAEVYDSDSNFLQKFDDLQLITMLPSFLDLCSEATQHGQIKVVDLGCGTGRNTLKLLSLDGAQIVGLDASPKMLEVARLRCRDRMSSLVADRKAEDVQLKLFDMLSGEDPPRCADNAIGVVSTLVLEHIPASSFFESVASLLVPGGYLLVTNMHPEMGAKSQAGFQDPHTGEKIRTLSYIHSVEDVVRVATQYNLEVVDRVRERAVNQEDVDILGKRAEKWAGVRCWFGAMFRKSTINTASRG